MLEKQMLEKQEEHEEAKETLAHAKARIEHELARIESKDLNDGIRNSLQKVHEVTSSIATIQEMLNIIWKRTEQLNEELQRLKAKTE